MKATSAPLRDRIVDSVGFEILGPGLAQDVRASLAEALAAGVVFPTGGDPLQLFRHELERAIRDIEGHEP